MFARQEIQRKRPLAQSLVGRDKGRQRVQPVPLHFFTKELELSRRGQEAALRSGQQVGLGAGRHKGTRQELVGRQPGLEGFTGKFLRRGMHRRLSNAQPGRQQLKHVGVRLCFAQRFKRLTAEAAKITAVGQNHIVLLKGRSRRQDNIRIVRAIRQEKIVDNGKQVRPLQRPSQLGLIGQ